MLQTDDLAAAVAAEEPTPSSEDCCDSTVDEMSTLGPSKSVTTTSTLTSVGLLKREAQTVLSLIKKKPIVAIDLDYTIWPALCVDHTLGPYRACRLEGTTTDNGKFTSVLCRDKRNSSQRLLSLFPESRDVLEWCVDHNIVLTICSRSPDKAVVQEILTAFEMWDWFYEPQIFPQRKINHFCNLVEAAKVDFTNFLFFDDDAANVKLCQQMGISGCRVRKSVGLNWQSLVKGLNAYYQNEQARVSLQSWLVHASSRQPSVDHSVTQNSSCYTTDNEAPAEGERRVVEDRRTDGERRTKYARLEISTHEDDTSHETHEA